MEKKLVEIHKNNLDHKKTNVPALIVNFGEQAYDIIANQVDYLVPSSDWKWASQNQEYLLALTNGTALRIPKTLERDLCIDLTIFENSFTDCGLAVLLQNLCVDLKLDSEVIATTHPLPPKMTLLLMLMICISYNEEVSCHMVDLIFKHCYSANSSKAIVLGKSKIPSYLKGYSKKVKDLGNALEYSLRDRFQEQQLSELADRNMSTDFKKVTKNLGLFDQIMKAQKKKQSILGTTKVKPLKKIETSNRVAIWNQESTILILQRAISKNFCNQAHEKKINGTIRNLTLQATDLMATKLKKLRVSKEDTEQEIRTLTKFTGLDIGKNIEGLNRLNNYREIEFEIREIDNLTLWPGMRTEVIDLEESEEGEGNEN